MVLPQKDVLTALYPDMSELMIHRIIPRQCGGVLENSVESRITEKSSAEEMINTLEEVTTRTRIFSSRVNLKTTFNTPWEDSVDKNLKENSDNIKYRSADAIRKLHIPQSTTNSANACPSKGKVNYIDIEKEPDVEKDDVIEDNSDDKSSIFSESSKYIENINVTFDIMESYSHFPQLSNGKLYFSKAQDAQLMEAKPNRGKGYTAGNSRITEVVINNEATTILLDPGAFCSCAGKCFLETCVTNFEDQFLPIDDIKFNMASNPMKALGIFENSFIFLHINENLRKTVEFFVMENCSTTHLILGNDYLIIQITVRNVSQVDLELQKFKSEKLNEAEISINPTDKQEIELSALLYDPKEPFESDKEPLGAIVGHEVEIILNLERPYPPHLRRPAYPGSPKSREFL
ncbi:hypothetical protein O181_013154 [Austropuccinia psidii MF-1]|uniref:Uncharacterized protein n=1 Tax=Austropuccinia psidii MF-1 TaxID=1389203 RepID=A0A9Q3GNK1_9BASI|nr:hypothetical protein [Austropuccinia psidii MF-1]